MCKVLIRQEIFDEFIQYRIASDRWSKGYQANLNAFDCYCIQRFPDEPALHQKMLNGWYKKRPTEHLTSTRSRTQVVTTLIRYIQKNHSTELFVPQLPQKYKRHYIPHSFSDQELAAFFSECDRQVLDSQPGEPALKALTISVIFRTLYSTGMRTTEARLLKTDDVNFDEGIISITSTKGDRQHFVALDSGLNSILIHYNKAAQRLFPKRKYFFYNKDISEPFSAYDLRYQFEKRWNKVNSNHAVPYDLRHNYAIRNINHWIASGFEFHDKFLYLSKSMGHSNLESTKYYYSLVPKMASIMHDCDNGSFNNLVPEVIHYEEE